MKGYHEKDKNGIIDSPDEGELIEIKFMDHSQKIFREEVGIYSNSVVETKEGKEVPLDDVVRWKYISKDEYDVS